MLQVEKFNIESGAWENAMNVDCEVEGDRFSSGAFRDAFHVSTKHGQKWVLKTYNQKAKNTIVDTLNSTVESHCRKQVQMHAVARHIANEFERNAPSTFGQCFKYNRCYYTLFDCEPTTIQEYVPGEFTKYTNSNGKSVAIPDAATSILKELYAKAQCLVHDSNVVTDHKLVFLDIQGAEFTLYDPEITTEEIMDKEQRDIYFCCGN